MPRPTMRPQVSPGENDIEGCRAFHLLSARTTKGPRSIRPWPLLLTPSWALLASSHDEGGSRLLRRILRRGLGRLGGRLSSLLSLRDEGFPRGGR
jgi:hypothetical protein